MRRTTAAGLLLGRRTAGNPLTAVPATKLDPDYDNIVEDEICATVAAAGIALDGAVNTQQIQAIRRLAGGNVRTLTANTTLTADDAGLIYASAASGNVTLTLPAANAAGGAPMPLTIIRTDSSANTLTVQRAGADTVEGLTSLAVRVAGRLGLRSDGAAAWSVVAAGDGRLLALRIFTATGTYTPTPGAQRAVIEMVGGGGAGGGILATGAGFAAGAGGGGGGTYGLLNITSGLVTQTVTIGAAGAGVAGGAGTAGGTSSFGALMSCPGGVGAPSAGAYNTGSVSGSAGGSGGAASGASVSVPGSFGSVGLTLAASSAIGSGGGSGRFGSGGQPNGANGAFAAHGVAATGFGAGGGGAVAVSSGTATIGGAGSPGLCLIWEYS